MAQAPQGGGSGGAPRQNKTVKQFAGMHTQNQRNAIPEGQFGWLENVQPIGPGNLHSIPGRGHSLVRIPPDVPPPPGSCPEDTVPDIPQNLDVVEGWSFNTGIPPGFNAGNNVAGQMNFVEADEDNTPEFYATTGERSGFASSYPSGVPHFWQLGHVIGSSITVATPVPINVGDTFDFYTQDAQGGRPGHSDEFSYYLGGSYNGGGTIFEYFSIPTQTYVGLRTDLMPPGAQGQWAKEGNNFWLIHENGRIYRFDLSITTGAPPIEGPAIFSIQAMGLDYSENYLYGWQQKPGDNTIALLLRIDKVSMALVELFEVDMTAPFLQACVVSDTLFYLVCDDGANWLFFYYDLSVSPAAVGFIDSVPKGIVQTNPASIHVNLHFEKGYFYIAGGAGTGEMAVVRVGPLVCPGSSPPVPIGQ